MLQRLLLRLGLGLVRRVAFLPEELRRPQERPRDLLPAHHVGPLVDEHGQIAPRLDPLRVHRADDHFRRRTDDERLGELLVASLGDPGDLRREPFDVLLLLHQEARRNEQRKVGVDVAGRLEPLVERLLDQLPDRIAVRTDRHAALDRRVIGELRAPDDVEIPLREVLRLRRDLRDLSRVVLALAPSPPFTCSRHALPIRQCARSDSAVAAFPRRGVSSVYRRAAGNRSGNGRRGSPRGAAPRARSAGPPSRCSPRATPPDREARRRQSVHRIARHGGSSTASAPRQAFAIAEQSDLPPHQILHLGDRDGAPDTRRTARCGGDVATSNSMILCGSTDHSSRRIVAHRTARPGRRTPGPRAANCSPGGSRRGRRCTPPRPPHTAPESTCGRRGRSGRPPSRSGPPARPGSRSRARSSPAAGTPRRSAESARGRTPGRDAPATDTRAPVRCALADDARATTRSRGARSPAGIVARHERLAVGIQQPRAFAAQRLRQQESRLARQHQAPSGGTGRTRDRRPRAPPRIRHRDAVAGGDRRIRRFAIDLAGAAGREQHGLRPAPRRCARRRRGT